MSIPCTDPISTAQRYRALMNRSPKPLTVSQLARDLGMVRSTVAHALRLLDLPPEIQRALQVGALTAGHCKVLARIKDHDAQALIAMDAITKRWSVRKTAREVQRVLYVLPAENDADIIALERSLSELIGSPVTIDPVAGVLVIDYRKDYDVLDGILEHLGYSGQ